MTALAMDHGTWVASNPSLAGERTAEERKEAVARAALAATLGKARSARNSSHQQLEGTIDDLNRRIRARPVPLSVRIAQAGLTWSTRRFVITCFIAGMLSFACAWSVDVDLPAALGIGFALGGGAPLWLITFLKKRREAKFLQAFPDAVDVIVRGIRAGLPLLDSMKVLTSDAPEPIRSEFRAIAEAHALGIPFGEACGKLYRRIAVHEANFFGIVIATRQQAPGSLPESLGNLSRLLRDRKKIAAEIQAKSIQAKVTVLIIACLPLAVMLLVGITRSQHIELLWTHAMGRVMLACGAAWAATGVLLMRKTIILDF